MCGIVKQIIMGQNKFLKTPCGFCFIEFNLHEEALLSVQILNNSKLDGRIIRVDLDPGFKEGRQFGRGDSGGQVRDEIRKSDDKDRMFFKKNYKKNQRRNDKSNSR